MFLKNGSDEVRFETFETSGGGRHLAANAVERRNPGWRAVAVTIGTGTPGLRAEGLGSGMERFAVAGRCYRCKAVVFEDERPRRDGERVVCFEC